MSEIIRLRVFLKNSLVTSCGSALLTCHNVIMFSHVMEFQISFTLTAATVPVVTLLALYPIAPFFERILPDILGRALSCPLTCGYLVFGLFLGTIPMSDTRRPATVYLPLVVQPLIELFVVVGSLVRLVEK